LFLQTLNWRHNPDIEKQINASRLRTKQLRSESTQIEKEIEQIEKENSRLSELNSKLEAILASAKQ
jgi:predicted nuclease with TOPRIM domain